VTIRSRCQRVAFSRLSDPELAAVLTRKGAEASTIDNVLPLSGGSAKVALGLLDDPVSKLWEPLAKRLLELATREGCSAGAMSPVLEIANALSELPQREAVFDRLVHLLRDAILLRTGSPSRLFHASLKDLLEKFAIRMSPEGLMSRLELVEDTRMLTRTFHMQPRLAFDRLCLAILAPPGAEGSRPLLDRRDIL
jgi:hypothetical protein